MIPWWSLKSTAEGREPLGVAVVGYAWRSRRDITSEVIVLSFPVAHDELMNKLLLVLVLVPFSLLSLVALSKHGYWGLFEPAFHSFAAAQVLVDLVIALGLFLAWLWRDAREVGRSPWPWLALTLAAGSFGPLLYLLTRKATTEGK